MRSLLTRAQQSSFFRATFLLAFGTAIAQLIPIALTPVLTRIYSTDDLGVLTLYSSFVIVFTGALSLGFGYALVSADEEDVLSLTALCFLSLAVLTIPVCLLALACIHWDVLGLGALPIASVISIGISMLVAEAFFIVRYLVLRHGAYRVLSEVSVRQSLVRSVAQVVLGLLGTGWWGLTLGDAAGRGVGVNTLWSRCGLQWRSFSQYWTKSEIGRLVRKYRDYALYSAPGSIVDSLGAQIAAPLLAAQFGIAVAGQYGVISRLLILPATLIGGSVADVFHQRLAHLDRSSPQQAPKLFLKVALGLILVSAAIVTVVSLIPDDLWTWALGDSWSMAGAYAIAIAPRAAALLVVSPLSRSVLVYGGQRSKLIYNISRVVAVWAVMAISAREDWSAVKAIAMVSWTQAAMSCVYILLLWQITRIGASRERSVETDVVS